MRDLLKIGDISERYNVTGRTLRYYEEIGLIQSTRNEETKYRYYDEKAASKINQILMLRRLTFSIKEIQEVFSTQDARKIIDILDLKRNTLKSELREQEELINVIERMINFIKSEPGKRESCLIALEGMLKNESEEINKELKKSEGLDVVKINNTLNNIRILKLHPMRVAYYCAMSENPEQDAWKVMRKWVKENKLDELFSTRYFGFNNPDPSTESNIYGYEVWVTVDDKIQGNDEIAIKTFEGGLYAAASTNVYDIVQSWRQLYSSIDKSENYKLAGHRWLEEHLVVDESSWDGNIQVDMYCPIEMLGK